MDEAKKSLRIVELDATRAAAMLAVCLSHSAALIPGAGQSALGYGAIFLGMVATPTFLLLSGVVCGYLTAVDQTIRELRWRLIDRGLFLLVFAHLALGLTHFLWDSASNAILRSFFITDAVGIGLIVAAFAAHRARPVSLLIYGLLFFVGASLVSSLVSPGSNALRYLDRLLFGLGDLDNEDDGYVVPLIPYLGIFLIGIAGGLEYSKRRAQGVTMAQLSRWCIRTGLKCMACALVLAMIWLACKSHLELHWRLVVRSFVLPTQKFPPGLNYVLTFGGSGLVLAGVITNLAQRARGRRFVAMLAVMGRASLMLYVLQYWIYFVPVRMQLLRPGYGLWLVTLPLSVIFLWWMASRWDRANCNRFLTLGLKRWMLRPIGENKFSHRLA